MSGRQWNANSYDRVGGPMTAMAAAVVDRLDLEGHETVLDAGCGTGRVSELLLERLPTGRVIAVDADPDMVRVASEHLAERAQVFRADLLDLTLDEPVDAVLSTATFHWVLDHQALFHRLFSVLRPGGHLVAQCGGEGNIEDLRAAGDEVAQLPEFAPHFAGWNPPWYYANPDQTAERLAAAGFVDVRTWLEPWPVEPEDPAEYLSTVTLGAQVQRLPDDLAPRYVDEVMARTSGATTVGYIRLNIDARRPPA